jgi:hypothetical protein
MPLNERGGILFAPAPADAPLRWLLAAIDELAKSTKGRPAPDILVDLRAVSPVPGMVEQTIIGEHLAQQLVHARRVATLVAEGTKTGYSERVARRLGLELKVFTSEPEAVEWLKSSA